MDMLQLRQTDLDLGCKPRKRLWVKIAVQIVALIFVQIVVADCCADCCVDWCAVSIRRLMVIN